MEQCVAEEGLIVCETFAFGLERCFNMEHSCSGGKDTYKEQQEPSACRWTQGTAFLLKQGAAFL
eukprot:5285731-Pleurochrysis_carterae.AAC.1